MTRFDIIVMTYYMLDNYWQDHKTEELRVVCDDLYPFVWAGENTADPAYFVGFCEMFEDKDYSVEEGYEIMKKYAASLWSSRAAEAADNTSFEDFEDVYEQYSENPKKV